MIYCKTDLQGHILFLGLVSDTSPRSHFKAIGQWVMEIFLILMTNTLQHTKRLDKIIPIHGGDAKTIKYHRTLHLKHFNTSAIYIKKLNFIFGPLTFILLLLYIIYGPRNHFWYPFILWTPIPARWSGLLRWVFIFYYLYFVDPHTQVEWAVEVGFIFLLFIFWFMIQATHKDTFLTVK